MHIVYGHTNFYIPVLIRYNIIYLKIGVLLKIFVYIHFEIS
jgi:hypothetical protein